MNALYRSTQQIDSASLHAVVSGLVRREDPGWTKWEQRAMAEVTFGLLFHPHVQIPPPLRSGKHPHVCGLVDQACTILREFVSDVPVGEARKRKALSATKSWVNESPDLIRKAYAAFKEKDSKSSEAFVRWGIAHDWSYHVARLNSLVDVPTFDEVAKVLSWTQKERRDVRRWSGDPAIVELWSKEFRQTGVFPPREVIDGYLVSALVRGRYYQNLAAMSGGRYVWHPCRDFVLGPVSELCCLDVFEGQLVRAYLAGLICRSAMEEDSNGDIVRSWADNIRKVKTRVFEIPPEGDREKAIRTAVALAKRCELSVRWKRGDDILEKATQHFVLPLVGLAVGVMTCLTTGSHAQALVAGQLTDIALNPPASYLAAKLRRAINGSTFHLSSMAEAGVHRVFAVTKEDLRRYRSFGACRS